MSVFCPLTCDYVCVAQSPRARIHAAKRRWSGTWPDVTLGPVLRTVCNLDGFVAAPPIDGSRDSIVAEWPPPITDRCEDCARLTGIGGKQRTGCGYWRDVVDLEATK